ncbi:MAG TPA: DMT family transporter, partial [Gemmataceae bacterium]|nr:DMT family transporter [Gemmataceae bacterium]
MQPTLTQGRICLALAAVLWSLSGPFTKLLTKVMVEEYDSPPIAPPQIAFYRVFFAALVLAPTLRPAELQWRPLMLAMGLCFAVMNWLYVTALSQGTAANAVLLQYTAPMWMYLASVFWLGEPADRRGAVALVIGLCGIAVILVAGWEGGDIATILIALGSGLTYAGVLIFLRLLRGVPSRWLTVWNHLFGAAFLLPFIVSEPWPTWQQYVVLFIFGSVQMGLSYWLA